MIVHILGVVEFECLCNLSVSDFWGFSKVVRECMVGFVRWITICQRMDISIGLVLVIVVNGLC